MKNSFLKKIGAKSYRIAIPAGGVRATVVQEWKDSYDLKIHVGAGSELRAVFTQNLPKTVEFAETVESVAGEKSKIHLFFIHLGAKKVKSRVILIARGKGAEINMDLAARAGGRRELRFELEHCFEARDGRGLLTAKGVAEGKSALDIRGILEIKRQAGGTQAHLTQSALNLSPHTQIKAVPALKIDTSDVKASHSASVTNLDEASLFYMQSRGLNEKQARKALAEGFLKEALEKAKGLITN
ncbi:MAG: SufD family Fe-S cluster assembly protein [Candidatus Peregrinibacteria bacterium]